MYSALHVTRSKVLLDLGLGREGVTLKIKLWDADRRIGDCWQPAFEHAFAPDECGQVEATSFIRALLATRETGELKEIVLGGQYLHILYQSGTETPLVLQGPMWTTRSRTIRLRRSEMTDLLNAVAGFFDLRRLVPLPT